MKPVKVVNGIDVTAHGGLIGRCVQRYKRFVGGCLEWEDLFQAGWLGMYHAAERFDPTRGFKFSTYANWWIRAFIQRAIMNERRTVRVPVHAQQSAFARGERLHLDALSLNAPVSADHPEDTWIDLLRADSDPEREAMDSDVASHIEAAVDALPDVSRRAIRGRFWGEHTLKEIGDDVGLSRERIRQREAQALERLELRLATLQHETRR